MALYRPPDYQINGSGGHFGFLIGRILALFFYLQVILMLSTKFGVNWPFGFSSFLSTSHPDASYQVSRQSVFLFQEEQKN